MSYSSDHTEEHPSPLQQALLMIEKLSYKLQEADLLAPKAPYDHSEGTHRNSLTLEEIQQLSVNDLVAYLHMKLKSLEALWHDDDEATAQLAQLSLLKRSFLMIEKLQEIDRQEEQRKSVESNQVVSPMIQSVARESTLPLSFTQQRLWFLDQLEPGKSVYNEYGALHIKGVLNTSAFEQSINEIIRRHESLRTIFVNAADAVVQRIVPWEYRIISPENLQMLSPLVREAKAIQILEEDLQQAFELNSGPLFRVRLLQLTGSEYVFLLVFHHIIGDGWSLGIFYRELASLYESYCQDQGSPLAELRIQYADFASWEQQRYQGTTLDAEMNYWLTRLHDAPVVLELPLDRPRAAVFSNRGSQILFSCPASLTKSLRQLCQREGITLFMALLAAFEVLLYRYTGQDDMLIGTTVANRSDTDLEALIGFFANTLVLRGNLAGNPTFREILHRVREVVMDTYEHQHVPFEQLVSHLQVPRDLSRTPLFQVMFVLQSASWLDTRLASCQTTTLTIDRKRATFDLVLSVVEGTQELQATLEYNTDLFERTTIERLAANLQTILQAAVAAPDLHLTSMPVLTEHELEQLLVKWNRTERAINHQGCIHELFEEQAAAHPHEIALVYRNTKITYEQLNRQANQLAHYLRTTFGVTPDTLIGICMERSPDMIVAVLGILKAGGAYLPLDLTHPVERLQFMLDDASVSIVLTEKRLTSTLDDTSATMVCLDADRSDIAQYSEQNPICQTDSGNLVYAIYTSGSTGEPKGVLIEHASLCNLIEVQIQDFSLDVHSRVLQFVSFNFDVSVADIFMSLCAGATLCLVPTEMMIQGAELVKLLREQQITIARIPPSVLAILPDETLPTLKTLISGGESWSSAITSRWRKGRRFLNEYGPTEATICTTMAECNAEEQELSIGRPLANRRVYILDTALRPVPIGVPGELFIGGDGLARGYLQRADLTAGYFLPDPFSSLAGARMYKTGDRVRYLADGTIKFLERVDHQVKIRGFRIELGEIESALALYTSVRECVVVAREEQPGNKQLVAYYVMKDNTSLSTSDLRTFLQEYLPTYMLPSMFVKLNAWPLTSNGKIDRKALTARELTQPDGTEAYLEPQTSLEQTIAAIWCEVLQRERVGRQDNYFDLGGHSLNIVQVHRRLQDGAHFDLSLVDLFTYPTIQSLAGFLNARHQDNPGAVTTVREHVDAQADIAIIGMAGRFPQAITVDEFWRNLRDGIESVSFFTEEEMLAAGIDAMVLHDPRFVPAGAVLEDVEWFDAAFFQYSPREAEIIDPQQRLFLESAWEALEDAGYDTERYRGRIAVYGGQSFNTYLSRHLQGNPVLAQTVDDYQLVMSNSPDFLTTRVSYKLSLQGPSVTVQTACSTSLVAVHMACESLRAGKCQMALAGGVSVRLPQKAGYLYQEGGIMSPDGHCRAFDEKAQGIVGGEGVGIVVLKRLEDALADGDSIRAIIKGSAINNDGATKVGFTAPSVQGQAQVIKEALAMADIEPETVSYIEAHGTGTFLGDAIEVSALRQVYQADGQDILCALGSVKTNVGHLDAAAGIAGLIKTVQALQHKTLPPSLHFTTPNPNLDLQKSHFYVNAARTSWERKGTARRAGISSFGIGGTNAHVIVEEAADQPGVTSSTRSWHILPLAARTESALQHMRDRLANYLRQHPDVELADVAYTLQVGRKAFKYRQVIICQNVAGALETLDDRQSPHQYNGSTETNERPVVFLFPGQGAQYIRMGEDLYREEAVFRQEIDRCAEFLLPHLGLDLRTVLYPAAEQTEHALAQLNQTWLTQPAIFALEYALAQLWISWGVRPAACIGHSIGEFVAACLSGVFSLETGLELVALRGRLMQTLPEGAMLAIPLAEQEVLSVLQDERVSIAAVNTSTQCVVAGPFEAISALEDLLHTQKIETRRIRTSHAFHSAMMEPMLAEFADKVESIHLQQPRLPYISNVTGTWITKAQATDPMYWTRQLRSEVRFADGINELLQQTENVFLEVGPGQTLSSFVKQQAQLHKNNVGSQSVIPSMRRASQQTHDEVLLLGSLGRLWFSGVTLDWTGLYTNEQRHRISLPTYPFERKRYWIERLQTGYAHSASEESVVEQREEISLVEADFAPTFYPRANLEAAYVGPRNEIEQKIVAIWQQFLGIGEIGVHDNFFDLGGSSLLATLIMSHLQSSLECEIPLRDLFEALTIAELAERVERITQERKEPSLIAVTRGEKLPLSFAQQRIWLDNQLKPGNPLYNIPIAARLNGSLNQEALEKSLHEIIARHETLRTHFVYADGQATQVIASQVTIVFPLIDLRMYTDDEREEELRSRMQELATQQFNLAQGPLFRVFLFTLHDDEHLLLFIVHHMVADGWSLGIFFNELVAHYTSLIRGIPAHLPDLPVQYVDFALWQRQWLQGEMLENHLAYWKKQLGGSLPSLDLPADRLRPPVQTYHGAHLSMTLPLSLVERLKQLSKQEDVTLFMLILAAFQVLLYRYTGLEDILVGTPIAGRNRVETEHLIGNFIGALVLRTDLSGNPSFIELLQRVREVTLSAYTHQDMPFEQLIEALQPQRDASRSPLFQVLLRLPNVPAEPLEADDLTLSIMQVKMPTASHDLTLDMVETAQGFNAQIEYNSDLFTEKTIKRFLEHWQTLLLSIVDSPAQKIAELTWLTEQEQRQLLVEWNEDTLAAYEPKRICTVFEAQVERTPEAIAVSMGREELSYRQLNQRANQLACYLRKMGVGPEEIVGVCIERSLNMVVALLGILKAGGAYVPLDPTYPEERLLFMLADTQVQFILSHQHLKQSLPDDFQGRTIYLDSDWQQIAQESVGNPSPIEDIQSLAYVIYTSGSTGTPKGVAVTHYGLYNLLQQQQKGFFISSSDRMLQFASINFDASVSEIITALCTGAQLFLSSVEELMPGHAFIEMMQRRKISLVTLPPSVLAVLPVSALSEVGTIVVAGETCSRDIVEQWAPGRRFINAYGPTENTVCATLGLCQAGEPGVPTIGRAVEGVQIFLLDTHLQPVPVGVPGEIHISGTGLARGYLHRPDVTADRFIPHPFSQQPGARLYKTGDLARYRPDGRIEFLGRSDHQIKIRGFRIEPGEIEAVLIQYPAMRECIIVPYEERSDKRLVAYFTVKQQQFTPTTSELRAYLQERLPEYMVPSLFVYLNAMPLTPAEKIDRQALPDPKLVEAGVESDDYEGPRNPLEELLAAAFADILGVQRVGIYENFFELGGHSLLATQLISQLLTSLQVDVPVHLLFEAPTVVDLALQVEQLMQSARGLQIPPIEHYAHTGALPLSFAQQRIWFMEQLQPENPLYAVSCALRISRPLNLTALEQSLQEIVRRQQILRATVVIRDGQPMQHILPTIALPLPVIYLDSLPLERKHNEVVRLAQEEALQPFDLERGPLLRTSLLSLGQDNVILLLTLHNLIADGWSREVWIRELVTLYQMYDQGTPAEGFPELTVQYTDYVIWQRQWMQGELLDTQLAYWRKQLAGMPAALQLPTDRPRPAVQTYRGNHIPISFSQALMQHVKEFCQAEGVTLFMFLLASFDILLSRYSGQEDIVVGTPVANRNRAELENIIGFFANSLVLRTKVDRNLSVRQLLAQVREMALGAYAHQDLPFEKLVEVLKPERNLSRSPLFQVMFTLQNTSRHNENVNWLWTEQLHVETRTAKFDLNVFLVAEAQNITGQLEYNTDLFDASTMMLLLQHWLILLEGMLESPDRPVHSLPGSRIVPQGSSEIQNTEKLPAESQATMTIAATFTVEPIQEALTFWLQTLGLPWNISFAPYHQLFQQLLDADSLLAQNGQGINVLLLRFEDWLRSEENTQELFSFDNGDDQKIEKNLRDLIDALSTARGRSNVPYLFCICPPSDDSTRREDVMAFFQRMEAYIVAEMRSIQGVTVITTTELLHTYPISRVNDAISDELGHVPYTTEGYTGLATIIARKLFATLHPPYKVIAVDCDNTLWSGVCGEDGPFGVKIKAQHRLLQEFLLEQQQAGMLICLCSKNNAEDVLAVFRNRPEMPLQLEHLAAWKINWQAKSTNLLALSTELQLGLNSFIFLDDNPLECAEVESGCPEVLTLTLDEKFTLPALKHVWAFDHLLITEEDTQRTAFYQANIARSQFQRSAMSYQEFLASLELEISIRKPEQSQLPRVAQLTQRTNQFNITGRRYTEAELQQLLQTHECLIVTVRDRFGDYGLVGVLIFAMHADALLIDTFLLSCRAMGRGVEHHMLKTSGELAQKQGVQSVVLSYRPGGKNKPAQDFLEQVGNEFKEIANDGSLTFSLPADFAAQVAYGVAPDLEIEETGNELAEKRSVAQSVDHSGSMQILKTIAELHTVEQIMDAIAQGQMRLTANDDVLVMPRTQIERTLVEIWQQLLHLPKRVGIHSNFFALGGHSLLATQLLSRIATVFLVKLPLQSIFEAPTIAQMAQLLENIVQQQQSTAQPAILPVARSAQMPLSFAQQRLWFLHQLMPESVSYNIPLQMRFRGPLNIHALAQSIQEIASRHEILRTTFGMTDGQPFQSIAVGLTLTLPIIDLRSLATEQRETEMLRLAHEDSQRLFNLANGPLIYTTLCRLEGEHHVLLITVHHIVFDAWSGGVLSRELMALYETLNAGKQPSLPNLPIQYADFASWQQQWLQGKVLDEQVAYWHKQLRGASSLELPADHPIPAQRTTRGRLKTFIIPRHISDALTALNQQEGTTLFMTMLAAFQIVLHRYSGQEDIVVGTDIANRTHEETEGLIGFFVNLLILRSTLQAHISFKELLEQVRKTVLEAYAHQDIPFEKIVDVLQLERTSNQIPLVRALFVLQNTPMPVFEVSGLSLSPVDVPLETTNFDLGLFLIESEQGITVRLNYSTELFEEATIAHMITHFTTLLESIVSQPEAAIGSLEMHTTEEKEVRSKQASTRRESRSRKLKKARSPEINL